MSFNEFDGVSSNDLKKQLRGIRQDIIETEFEGWYTDEWGEERFEIGADYFLSDLRQRECELKKELAKRMVKQCQTISL